MDAYAQEVTRGRGRPRDEEKDSAIREAAWRVLAEKGYEGLTFEAVAELAQCSRSTLYRRFAGKAELVEAVLGQTSRALEPNTDNMAPREVLIAHATALREYMSDVRGPATLNVSVSAPHHPELAEAIKRHSSGEQEYYLREFRRLGPQGMSAEALDFAFNTLVGSVIFHVAIRRIAPSDAQIALLVDQSIALLNEGNGCEQDRFEERP
jgi:AcrR family transcriptional regulator